MVGVAEEVAVAWTVEVDVVACTLVCAEALDEMVSWTTLELDDDGAAEELMTLLLVEVGCCVEDGRADVAEVTTLVEVALPS